MLILQKRDIKNVKYKGGSDYKIIFEYKTQKMFNIINYQAIDGKILYPSKHEILAGNLYNTISA